MNDKPMDPARVAQGLYLNLDVLYDTRLATLEEIDPRLVPLALKANYFQRQEDSFPFVSKDDFTKVYARRDVETLQRALPTDVFRIVGEFLRHSVPECIDNPWGDETEIFLNVYPYKIDKITAQNMLRPLLELAGGVANVSVLNMTDAQVTTRFCYESISLMCLYHWDEWLGEQCRIGNLPKHQIPNVTLVAPKLYWEKVPTPEELRRLQRQGFDPWDGARAQGAGLINLQFAEVEAYCAKLTPQEVVAICANGIPARPRTPL